MAPFEIIQYTAAIFVATCFLTLAAAIVYAVVRAIRGK